ncbi:hypothetical protein PO909_014481 [Leuciscus waleckii]
MLTALTSSFEFLNVKIKVSRHKIMLVSRRCLDRIFSIVLLAVVLLSWGFVIYGTRIAAQWELEKRQQIKQQQT